ncbi:DUF4350 domain-containing protein [Agromyces sp. SYSU K20354]|uniref:DUF4350 domain-containing protein n=1 Tax=Agromyces cavernae TaxID=2898659 RepID=UPI001E52293B|nr:DUF4350 domain-containing protein [Agromyces cavernae]MCD2444018.1 DUF4350 domain-containing protein [Agromyces cavernae]
MSGASTPTGVAVGTPDHGPADAAVALTPTVRSSVRRRRIWIGFAALLVLGAIVIFVVQGAVSGGGPRLGADNPGPTGAKALVQVLADHGVTVTDARSYDAALEGAHEGATVVLYDEYGLLGDDRLARLAMFAQRLVVVEPGFGALEVIAPGVRLAGAATGPLDDVACDVPTAQRAGSLSDGQRLLTVDDDALDAGWVGCFRDADFGHAVVFGETDGGSEIALVAAATPFENGRIAEHGNAALAIGLAGASDDLVWYLPGPGDADAEAAPTLGDLTPGWVSPMLVLAIIVVIAAGVWQGRRFGPLVAENLPVHIPARETSEGRARLYARNTARTHALDQLRIGAIQRIASVLRLPRTAHVDEVSAAAAAATGREAGAVHRLLADDAPTGDRDLVRLAADLTTLEDQVRATLAPATSHPEAGDDSAGRRP